MKLEFRTSYFNPEGPLKVNGKQLIKDPNKQDSGYRAKAFPMQGLLQFNKTKEYYYFERATDEFCLTVIECYSLSSHFEILNYKNKY